MNEARDLSKKVKNYAIDNVGFDLVGIASAFDPQFDRAPEGHHPEQWLPGAKSVITGGIKVIREILVTTPSTLYAKHYDQMNTWLSEAGYRLARGLQDMGFQALYFPETDPYPYLDAQRDHGEPRWSPSFSHIHAAVAAGLWPDFSRVAEVHRVEDVSEPGPENKAVYESLLPVFRQAAETQAQLGDALHALGDA